MMRASYRCISIGLVILTVLFLTSCTKASGGGWLLSTTGQGKATFGFNGKCRDTVVAGVPVAKIFAQLEYKDGSAGVRLHGTIDGSSFSGMTCAQVQADFDAASQSTFSGLYGPQPAGATGTFVLTVTDAGEPGILGDRFSIQLIDGAYDGYSNDGLIGGGNIQVR